MCLLKAAKPTVHAAPTVAPSKTDADIQAEAERRRVARNQSGKGFQSHFASPSNDNEDDSDNVRRIVLGG